MWMPSSGEGNHGEYDRRSAGEAHAGWLGICSVGRMELATLVGRARNEFLESPGLQLTLAEAEKLWGLETRACRDVIDILVKTEFLRWTPRRTVIRA